MLFRYVPFAELLFQGGGNSILLLLLLYKPLIWCVSFQFAVHLAAWRTLDRAVPLR